MTLKNQEETSPIRVGVYIDGFNLYHPIDKLYQGYMKWLNLWKLSENLCTDPKEEVVKVVFCTALPKNEPDRHDRHSRYIGVLEGAGVEVIRGHRMGETKTCMHCKRPTEKQIEKQSDINVALMLILDAEDDVFDRAYLISADSDQAATARVFKSRFPHKTLYNAVPPGQEISANVRNHASKCFSITESHIEYSLFKQFEKNGKGKLTRRPDEYDPFDGYVYIEDRPKKGDKKKPAKEAPAPMSSGTA